jgi:hypothetical protein
MLGAMERRGGHARRGGARRPTGRTRKPWWAELPSAELLEVRLCDLGLELAGTALEARVERLHEELERAGFRFRPYVWLSTDWFTPDGLTGFAVPFYLAHPRLARLERAKMLEVEGGTYPWCMRLLRHETAHALDNAYRLRKRTRYARIFGAPSRPYRESYVPSPRSRRYVHNLDQFYSQSHPVEDFAETFSVWLQPGSRWRTTYRGWPALTKLEYVEALMHEIRGRAPALRTREREETLATQKTTLREHYEAKQGRYDVDLPSTYDQSLLSLFAPRAVSSGESASGFLQRRRQDLRRRVAAVTGHHPYLVDQVLRELVPRCRKLGLRLKESERRAFVDVAILVTSLTTSLAESAPPRYCR